MRLIQDKTNNSQEELVWPIGLKCSMTRFDSVQNSPRITLVYEIKMLKLQANGQKAKYKFVSLLPPAQCTLHHSCDSGRRRSHHDRDGGLLLGFPPSRDSPPAPVMNSILQEVTAIRHFLEKRDRCREVAKEWLQVGYVLDVLLFRVYLVAMVTYSITLGTLWAVWQGAWVCTHDRTVCQG